MAYSLKEFADLDLSQLKNNIITQCCLCYHPILDFQESKKIPKGLVHDDCYYDDLSKIIDLRPIGFPMSR